MAAFEHGVPLVLRGRAHQLEAFDLVLLRPSVLRRASDPMPMSIGTLGAIHLASALIWRDRMGTLPQVATHDVTLGAAARAFGFDVRGA